MDFEVGQQVRLKEGVSVEIGQQAKLKEGVSVLPMAPVPGMKATITGFGASGKVLFVETERGTSCWVNAEDVEPV